MAYARSTPPTSHGAGGEMAVTSGSEHLYIGPSHPKAPFYIGIFVILFIVTGMEVSVSYASFLPQIPILLVLAVLKFGLIAAFYMHLRFDSRMFAMFFLLGLAAAIGMLLTLMALFTAHSREPFEQTPLTQSTSATPAAGTPTSGAVPGAVPGAGVGGGTGGGTGSGPR
jgi:cytochrome c oxidase subunit IV